MDSGHDTREVLHATVKRPGVREWTLRLVVGAPVHAPEIDAIGLGPKAVVPSCVAAYEMTATIIPEPDGESGNLVITGKTRADDEELVAEFVQAVVLAATRATDRPPAGWQP